jgi:hypothetical protein
VADRDNPPDLSIVEEPDHDHGVGEDKDRADNRRLADSIADRTKKEEYHYDYHCHCRCRRCCYYYRWMSGVERSLKSV